MGNEELGVGMVGHAFMGAVHSQAWRTAPHFFDLPLRPALRVALRVSPRVWLCGRAYHRPGDTDPR